MALHRGLAGGAVGLVVLLVALAATVGLAWSSWGAGLGCGALVALAVARGIVALGPVSSPVSSAVGSGAGAPALGPADLVTLARLTLACAVAAVVAESLLGSSDPASSRPVLVALAVAALVLDAVDGRVARRTGTCSAFGARFDGEADAFLLMVLSVEVAPSVGGWVLAIGAARYVFGAAGWWLPWLRRPLPPRYWRKVVAAVQGVVLTAAAAAVLPAVVVGSALLVALALLAESFGRDVLWLWAARDRTAHAPAQGHAVRVGGMGW